MEVRYFCIYYHLKNIWKIINMLTYNYCLHLKNGEGNVSTMFVRPQTCYQSLGYPQKGPGTKYWGNPRKDMGLVEVLWGWGWGTPHRPSGVLQWLVPGPFPGGTPVPHGGCPSPRMDSTPIPDGGAPGQYQGTPWPGYDWGTSLTRTELGYPIPQPGQDWGTPLASQDKTGEPARSGNPLPRDWTVEQVLATQWTVCLLHSRRRTTKSAPSVRKGILHLQKWPEFFVLK